MSVLRVAVVRPEFEGAPALSDAGRRMATAADMGSDMTIFPAGTVCEYPGWIHDLPLGEPRPADLYAELERCAVRLGDARMRALSAATARTAVPAVVNLIEKVQIGGRPALVDSLFVFAADGVLTDVIRRAHLTAPVRRVLAGGSGGAAAVVTVRTIATVKFSDDRRIDAGGVRSDIDVELAGPDHDAPSFVVATAEPTSASDETRWLHRVAAGIELIDLPLRAPGCGGGLPAAARA